MKGKWYLMSSVGLNWLEEGNYKYYGYKVKNATIDTSTLDRNGQGIIWNPKEENVGKLCPYKVTLEDKQGKTISVRGKVKILDIIETKQKNPSLVLQDQSTRVVAGSDLEIQTSSFLNHQETVMSKVLGCTIYKQTERNKLIHCDLPKIHNYEPLYPVLYCIKSKRSIYVGITHRNLKDRVSEHCTLTKDKSVQVGKSTFDMIASEGAEVYCIGEFPDYTLEEVANMSDEERTTYHHKMESVETLLITLAKMSFSTLECINRKQVLTDSDRYQQNNKIARHIARLPFINFTLDFEIMRQNGLTLECINRKQVLTDSDRYQQNNKIARHIARLPFINFTLDFEIMRQNGFHLSYDKMDWHESDKVITYEGCPYKYYLTNSYYNDFMRTCDSYKDMRHFNSEDKMDWHESDKVITYEGCPYKYYLTNSYYNDFMRTCDSYKDMRHFNSEYYFEYAMLVYELLSPRLLFLVKKKMRRLDKREERMIDYDTIHEQMENMNEDDQFYDYYKDLYDNRHLYKFTNKKWHLMYI